jgi:hypothetical protein
MRLYGFVLLFAKDELVILYVPSCVKFKLLSIIGSDTSNMLSLKYTYGDGIGTICKGVTLFLFKFMVRIKIYGYLIYFEKL